MIVAPPPVGAPQSRGELQRDLAAVGAWAHAAWSSFATDAFFAPLGEAWSPADNVRHLIKSNRPVARALGLPRILLLLRFGLARRPSRSYTGLRDTYREALGAGLRAGGYAPSPLPPERRTAEQRATTLELYAQSVAALGSALGSWSEGALDRLRLPHPGLGPLTVREMVFFTVYHNTHHVLGVARRLGEGAAAGAAVR